jgi:hypothetical protein
MPAKRTVNPSYLFDLEAGEASDDEDAIDMLEEDMDLIDDEGGEDMDSEDGDGKNNSGEPGPDRDGTV